MHAPVKWSYAWLSSVLTMQNCLQAGKHNSNAAYKMLFDAVSRITH